MRDRIALVIASAATPALAQPLFTDIQAPLPGLNVPDLAWGDPNADGLLDLALTGLEWFIADTTEIFVAAPNDQFTQFQGVAAPGLYFGAVSWADYDADGDDDLLIVGDDGQQLRAVLYRNANGVLLSVITDIRPAVGASIDWADVDGDADLDLLVTGDIAPSEPSEPRSIIYRNDEGVFVETFAEIAGVLFGEGAFADFDADGDPDLAVAGEDIFGQGIARVYRNDGGDFTQIADLGGVRLASVDWADVDDDDDLDLLISGAAPSASTILYRNDAGAFVDAAAPFTGVAAGAARFGDYNADGSPDVLVVGGTTPYVFESGDGLTQLYRNDGAGAFVPVDADLLPLASADARFADYDADGDLDIAIAGANTANGVGTETFAIIYRNDGPLADMNGDGDLSIFDFLAFQSMAAAGDPAADMNDDGATNVLDFLAMQHAYQNGW